MMLNKEETLSALREGRRRVVSQWGKGSIAEWDGARQVVRVCAMGSLLPNQMLDARKPHEFRPDWFHEDELRYLKVDACDAVHRLADGITRAEPVVAAELHGVIGDKRCDLSQWEIDEALIITVNDSHDLGQDLILRAFNLAISQLERELAVEQITHVREHELVTAGD